jgi:S-adenosyl methyltransferase
LRGSPGSATSTTTTLVLAHARALLYGTPKGLPTTSTPTCTNPTRSWQRRARTLDFTRPVAVMLLGITAHITDDEQAYTTVRRLLEPLAPGSYLGLCDDTNVIHPEAMDEMIRQWNASGENPRVNRTPGTIARFFDGLEVLDPGVVSVTRWRPDPFAGEPSQVDDFGGVARKAR